MLETRKIYGVINLNFLIKRMKYLLKITGLLCCLACLSLSSCTHQFLVLNKGIGGNNSNDLLRRVNKDVLQEKPDLVVLMVGSNDMINSQKLINFSLFKDNYQQLINQIKSTGAKLVLMSPPPVDTGYIYKRHDRKLYTEPLDYKLDSLNKLVRQMAKTNDVHFVDLYSLFKAKGSPNREVSSLILNQQNFGKEDGTHPTKQGYQLIAETVYNYLRKNHLLKKGKKMICFGDSITYGAYMTGEGTATGETYPAFLSRLINH